MFYGNNAEARSDSPSSPKSCGKRGNHRIRFSRTGWTLFSAAVFALLFSGVANAQSHLGQDPNDHVILSFYGQGQSGLCGDGDGLTMEFSRVFPDGTRASFSIPTGKLFVVTDFDLTSYVGVFLEATPARGGTLEAKMRIARPNHGSSPIVYRSSFHLVQDLESGNFTRNFQTLAGISVAKNSELCPEISWDNGLPGQGVPLKVTSGTYRGYLISDGTSDQTIGLPTEIRKSLTGR
jgi:hypothetical protein